MTTTDNTNYRRSPLRVGVAVAISLLIVIYTLLVVGGGVPNNQRIDAVHLVIIAVGALCCVLLLKPGFLDRVSHLEVQGLKIDLLERIRERQIRQENDLEDIRLLIPLLFRDEERKHLSNLARGKTTGYKGEGSLREELRRLCSIGLLRRRDGHHIRELQGDGVFDLSEYVELTELGQRWVRRLTELDDAAVELTTETK